jgi:rRNA maturation endonuclease Nob1
MSNDGRCDGCGEIIVREDYERGECRWCGREV